MNKIFARTLALGSFVLLLSACGYNTPEGGGAFTPFVVVVTATPPGSQQTALAQATRGSNFTPTLTSVSITTTTSVAPTDTPTSSLPTPTFEVNPSGKYYLVEKGDTLRGIANKLSVNYDDLVKLNKITDPDSLQIGQKLLLPKPRPTPVQ